MTSTPGAGDTSADHDDSNTVESSHHIELEGLSDVRSDEDSESLQSTDAVRGEVEHQYHGDISSNTFSQNHARLRPSETEQGNPDATSTPFPQLALERPRSQDNSQLISDDKPSVQVLWHGQQTLLRLN